MRFPDPDALRRCSDVGLRPIFDPLGEDGHHTEVEISPEDAAIGHALSWFLGSMWCDVDEHYFYNKRTSIEEWSRVARALRIHGLKITNSRRNAPMPNKIARYGWLPQLPDQRDKLWRPQFMKTYGVVALPATTDLRPQCPPVYDQGQLSSCTANAIAAAFDFERHRQSEPFMTPSRLFIYYNERAIEGTIASDAGANLRDGFKVINSHGVCYESQWPYDISQFVDRPWPKCYATAKKEKCLQYLALTIEGDQDASPQDAAIELRQCLAEGYPFVYGFTVYDSFESDSVAASGIVNLPAPTESVVGGHAVLCVGYDDTTQRFLCRNSWGSSWGMAGYFTIPYAYLSNPNLASDFWTIRLVSK